MTNQLVAGIGILGVVLIVAGFWLQGSRASSAAAQVAVLVESSEQLLNRAIAAETALQTCRTGQ
jgi:hypothetical protein